MYRHPDLIGGFNRLDSTIIKACDGKVIAKEGADGLLGLSVAHEDYPDRDDKNWRKHTLAHVNGPEVKLSYRPVHTEPLTSEADGGIDLKKIVPKKRVY